jgi:hypothetical protein
MGGGQLADPDFANRRQALAWLADRGGRLIDYADPNYAIMRNIVAFGLPTAAAVGLAGYFLYQHLKIPGAPQLSDTKVGVFSIWDPVGQRSVPLDLRDPNILRELRLFGSTMTYQQKVDLIVGREMLSMFDGHVLRPQLVVPTPEIHVTQEAPLISELREAGVMTKDFIYGVGDILADGADAVLSRTQRVVNMPGDALQKLNDEHQKLNENIHITRTAVTDTAKAITTQTINLITKSGEEIEKRITSAGVITQEALKVPGEYIKETSSTVVRNLSIATVLAGVLYVYYKYGDM